MSIATGARSTGRAGGSVAVLRPIAMGSLAGNVPTRARSRRASRAAALGRRARPWAGALASARVRGLRFAGGMAAISGGTHAPRNPSTRNRVPRAGVGIALGGISGALSAASASHGIRLALDLAGCSPHGGAGTSPPGLQQDVAFAAERKLYDAVA